MEHQQKLFAFRLAAKKQAGGKARQHESKQEKWKAREGVAIAGCTDPTEMGLHRYSDNGVWC